MNEQQIILNEISQGNNVVIQAFAGCGKTTILETIAKEFPEKSILYIAFNKANVVEATKRFPENVICTTFNSLAYKEIVKFPKSAMGKRLSSYWNLEEWSQYFFKKEKEAISAGELEILFNSVKLFEGYLTSLKMEYNSLFELENDYVKFISFLEKEGTITHDFYVERYCQKQVHLHYDFIMIDEVQDMNPVFMKILETQLEYASSQIIAVGDPYQAIYAFRNAINAFSFFETEYFVKCYLSTSYRFTRNIAEQAMYWLEKVGNTKEISVIKTDFHNRTQAFLGRTNVEVISSLLSWLKENPTQKVNINIDLKTIFSDLFHIESLFYGKQPKFPSKGILYTIRSKKELEKLAETNEEIKSKIALTCLCMDNKGVYAVKKLLEGSHDSTSPITFSTGHKSKGFEWDSVTILPEIFQYIQKLEEESQELRTPIDQQVYHLIYIMVTRAKYTCY